MQNIDIKRQYSVAKKLVENLKQQLKEAEDIVRNYENILNLQTETKKLQWRKKVPLWQTAAAVLYKHGAIHVEQLQFLMLEEFQVEISKQSLVGILIYEKKRKATFNQLGGNIYELNAESEFAKKMQKNQG